MAFYQHQLHWNGATGSYQDFKPEYTAVWRLFTDDPNDQAQQALAYVVANIAMFGDLYAYANDVSMLAVLRRIVPARELGSTYVWTATLHYAVPDDNDEKKDENGKPSDNPLDWRADISVNTVQYTKPVEQAEYISGFVGMSAQCWPKGMVGPVLNSAMTRFDPAPEADHGRKVIRVKKNLAWFDCNSLVTNVINKKKVQFDYRGLKQTVPKHQGKIRDFSVEMRTHNAIDYLELQIWIDVNPEGWLLKIYDRGIDRRAMAGDPDGRGGIISASDELEGEPPTQRILDFDQMPIMDPVFFDGDGQPIKRGGRSPVVLTYRPVHYSEVMFQRLAPFAGIFT